MGLIDYLFRKKSIPRNEKEGKPLPHWKELPNSESNAPDENCHISIDDSFWKTHLSGKEYNVTRSHGTELARSSVYDKFYPRKGYFACRCCGLPLYSSESKFDSGTGWPSFGEHIQNHVQTSKDFSYFGIGRTELHCARCHAHLGHVFSENGHRSKSNPLKIFSERQCINGISLWYILSPLDPRFRKMSTVFEK